MKKIAIILLLLYSLILLSAEEYSYTDFNALIDKYSNLENQYPDYVSSQNLGYSQELGLPIKCFKITNENNNQQNKKNILIIGSVYAKDIFSAHLLYSWSQTFLEQSDETETALFLSTNNLWIIPSLNPDGLNYALTNNNYSFMNNLRDNQENNIFNPLTDGVNLNRNFPFNWIHGNNLNNTNNNYFRGNRALSENESKALYDFLQTHKTDFALVFLSEETQENSVIFPYNWFNLRKSPDFEALNLLSDNLAQMISNDTSLWSASPNQQRNGNLLDYLYVNEGILPLAFSFETSNNLADSLIFEQKKAQISTGIRSFLRFLNNSAPSLNYPGILELNITDFNNSCLEAKVKIEQNNSSAFQKNISSVDNGKFFRILNAGTYNIMISKKGYEDYSMELNIENNQYISQDIQLVSLTPIQMNLNTRFMSQNINAKVIIDYAGNIDTLYTENGFISYNSYFGSHQITVLSDSLAPVLTTINAENAVNNIFIDLSYYNTAFSEKFDGSCCSWILNGPWLVVQDGTHNSQFITDSWSGNGFYAANSDNNMQVVFPINLFGYDDQDLYLCFDQAVYTEWDNDFVKVEISYDGSEWFSIYKFAGNTKGWQQKIININPYKNHEIYLRFRITDGFGDNPNHEGLTDPGWNIDDIRIISSTGNVPNHEISINSRDELSLSCYPNPFNPALNINFEAGKDIKYLQVKIYNIKGQMIDTIDLSAKDIKSKQLKWNAEKISSGIYFIQLSNNHIKSKIKKVILIK